MLRTQLVRGDGIPAILGGLLTLKAVLTKDQVLPLATEDLSSLVVALLHAFGCLATHDVQAILVIARIAQHVEEERHALVEVGTQRVHVCNHCTLTTAHANIGGKEVQLLIQISRLDGGSAAGTRHRRHHSSESRRVLGIKPLSALKGQRQ